MIILTLSYYPPCKSELKVKTECSSSGSLCKQIVPRSGMTKRRAWSGFTLFDNLMVFLKAFFERVNYEKSIRRQIMNYNEVTLPLPFTAKPSVLPSAVAFLEVSTANKMEPLLYIEKPGLDLYYKQENEKNPFSEKIATDDISRRHFQLGFN